MLLVSLSNYIRINEKCEILKINRDDITIVDIEKDYIHKVKHIKDQPNGFPTIRYIRI